MIYWFTGQPGHGKTTLAKKLKSFLELNTTVFTNKIIHVDGDDLRRITSNVDYSVLGRRNNIVLAQQIARFLHNQDYIVIVSLVAPFREMRDEFKKETGCREIYVFTTDIRGKEIFHTEYEKPLEDFLLIDTTSNSSDESLRIVTEYFKLV